MRRPSPVLALVWAAAVALLVVGAAAQESDDAVACKGLSQKACGARVWSQTHVNINAAGWFGDESTPAKDINLDEASSKELWRLKLKNKELKEDRRKTLMENKLMVLDKSEAGRKRVADMRSKVSRLADALAEQRARRKELLEDAREARLSEAARKKDRGKLELVTKAHALEMRRMQEVVMKHDKQAEENRKTFRQRKHKARMLGMEEQSTKLKLEEEAGKRQAIHNTKAQERIVKSQHKRGVARERRLKKQKSQTSEQKGKNAKKKAKALQDKAKRLLQGAKTKGKEMANKAKAAKAKATARARKAAKAALGKFR